MAAHVFDGSEPDIDLTPSRPIGSTGGASAISAGEAPMFASRPAVFDKVHERQRVGAGPLIGLAVGAVIVGGLVFAMSSHHQGANGATDGRHLTSHASSHALTTASPATSPVNTGPSPVVPVKAAPSEVAPAKAAPTHLRIVAAPPARAARTPARLDARPAVGASAPRARTAQANVVAPSRLSITPSTAPNPAPAPAPSAAPEVSAPAPSLSTPAPQPTTEPAPAPSTAAPDAGGQATPQ